MRKDRDKIILDEIEDEMRNKVSKKSKKIKIRFLIWEKIRVHIQRILYASLIFFIFFIVFSFITEPLKYSDSETAITEKRIYELLHETGDVAPKLVDALNVLKKYPNYYKKVVNNIQEISIDSKCEYACICSTVQIGNTMELILPKENNAKKILHINPHWIKTERSNIDIASVLVHETDHVEYLESSRVRRIALNIKCNALLNPNISITSGLISVIHRIDAKEICAEKEQIKFHKLTGTESGYEFNNGIFANFFENMANGMGFVLSIF